MSGAIPTYLADPRLSWLIQQSGSFRRLSARVGKRICRDPDAEGRR